MADVDFDVDVAPEDYVKCWVSNLLNFVGWLVLNHRAHNQDEKRQ